ncbi:protein ERGIC-53 [Diorhabda sublineata]|uniref:protein ERGIC-53 n=1 Tax=Diorhabda sublineata TaxID=1163346 RepID=UPI0024E0C5DE|nr:protein ERGIC-53 [Diorhabda sublineata]
MIFITHFLLFFIFILNNSDAKTVHRTFEYKYSFKPPYLAQKDGSVPFWEYGGNAIASSENVRIAPSLKSQKGAIWTKQPINFDWWEVDIAFRITGRGRIGADGLAFWYTQNKGSFSGDIFGSSDQWVGLGLFFDSFDNDNKHNNPYIMAVLNDGTKQFDHQNDGTTQQLAGCLRDFRNKPYPTRAKIEYYQNTLTVLFNNGMTNNEKDFDMCLRAENIVLPRGGYFGISAATGGLADDHDVIHFLTKSLHPIEQSQQNQIVGEDQQKLQQEYQEYQQKLEAQKAEYKKEHPDERKDPDVEDWFESESQRELRQIFQGQNQIYEVLREVNKKIDEIVGRQERTMSLISQQASMVQGGGAPPPPPGIPAAQVGDTIRRHEVDALFNNHNLFSGYLQEIKQFVVELKLRADTILNNQAKQPTAQVQSVGYDTQSLISEMRDGLNHVKQNLVQLSQKAPAQQNCPVVTCVNTTTVLMIAAVQLAIILAYNLYRDSRESSSKKFY